jgi:probable DNA repair protein
MPHATAQLDWDLAESVTARLLASASQVHFSYARQKEGVEVRPSQLVAKVAGPAQPVPPELTAPRDPSPLTEQFEDRSQIRSQPGKVSGGSSVLTAQSQCPFKAFATARLNAQSWKPAEAGLTASQRGTLLHAVLHSVWAGPPDGIRSLSELQAIKDRESFVAGHVRRVIEEKISKNLTERMPRRYLELESQRLVSLVTEWLDFEATRIEFEVANTEVEKTVHISGLTFDLRLDRIDRLRDDSLLVIDYKSGEVNPKSWELPRPDDVQLPLYASFAVEQNEELGGLVFAKVQPGEPSFAGLVGDAKATLKADLSNSSNLVRNNSLAESLIDWRLHLEQLAKDFLDGRAEVDPREYPKTCERCGLQTLCRIQESQALLEDEDENSEGESDE